jgi:polysaccharide biosynthesis protein PslH
MMHSLSKLGHSISLLTAQTPNPNGIEEIDFEWLGTFGDLPIPSQSPPLTVLQSKFCSYWGVDKKRIAQIQNLVEAEHFDVVVAVGLHVLPYLSGVRKAVRVWYAADEWLLHHCSLIQWNKPSSWSELRPGLIKGLYERSFAKCVDRVWAVSKMDARFFRIIMGSSNTDVVPNGVDFDHFAPQNVISQPDSCVFWGRLDFAPNLDAIRWFGENVFSRLRQMRPNASWTVYGFGAGNTIHQLKVRFGFELVCDLPDLRSAVSAHRIVVLPFVTGAGLKNKFLEAAAMGLTIVASKKATNGLSIDNQSCKIVSRPHQWQETIIDLWDNQSNRERLAANARDWVVANHSWLLSAQKAAKELHAK